MNHSDIFDGDSPYIELDGQAVSSLTWHEGGIYTTLVSGCPRNVTEDIWFVCGAAVIRGMDLNLRFGEQVTPKYARFGEE